MEVTGVNKENLQSKYSSISLKLGWNSWEYRDKVEMIHESNAENVESNLIKSFQNYVSGSVEDKCNTVCTTASESDDDSDLPIKKTRNRNVVYISSDSDSDDSDSSAPLYTARRPNRTRPPVFELSSSEEDEDSYESSFIDDSEDEVSIEGFKSLSISADPLDNLISVNNFAKEKFFISSIIFKEFNDRVCDGSLPSDTKIEWNNRLQSTAGMTKCKKKWNEEEKKLKNVASIELSTKVLTDVSRLKSTLVHELCHAACWLLDDTTRPPHGDIFKKWGTKAEKAFPSVTVKTCHNYNIQYKFTYECTNDWCTWSIGRHSKSIDVNKKGCGRCGSRLELKGGGQVKPPNAYSLFVKEHYNEAKKLVPHGTMADVNRKVAEMWKERKQNSVLPK